MESDFGKKYVLRCIKCFLNLQSEPSSVAKSTFLDDFLQDDLRQNTVLLVSPGNQIRSYKYGESLPADCFLISITKLASAASFTKDNISQKLSVELLPYDPLLHLQDSLRAIYIPLCEADPALSGLLQQLKALQSNQFDRESVRLYSPSDEFEFWKAKLKAAKSPEEKRKAKYFVDLYGDIEQTWTGEANLRQLTRVVESTAEVLDSVWTNDGGYPEERYGQLLSAFSTALFAALGKQAPRLPDSLHVIPECIAIFKRWDSLLREYVNEIFPSVRRYLGSLDFLAGYNQRIKKVERVALLANELDRAPFNFAPFFEPFSPFVLTREEGLAVEAALIRLSGVVQARRPSIVGYFGQLVSQFHVPGKLLKGLKAIGRFPILWDEVKDKLQLSQVFYGLKRIIQQMDKQFQNRSLSVGQQRKLHNKTFSEHVGQIVWARQAGLKAKRLSSGIVAYFKASPQADKAKESFARLAKDYGALQKQLFQQWKEQVEQSQREGGLEFDPRRLALLDPKTGEMRVSFSDRLLQLIREVRQLLELGFKKQISAQTLQVCEEGKRFFKEAVALKSIAHFYNGMAKEVLDCQSPLIYDQAEQLQSQIAAVSSHDKFGQEQLQLAIRKLSRSCQLLERQNARIKGHHSSILDAALKLGTIPLDAEGRKLWLQSIAKVRGWVADTCAGKLAERCLKWKLHWDVQFAKLMNSQFQKMFRQPSTLLREEDVSLVFARGNIELRPRPEQLRGRLVAGIKDLICWPARVFKGVEYSEPYDQLPSKNVQAVAMLLTEVEQTIKALRSTVIQLKDWQALSKFGSLIRKLSQMRDWEHNIKNMRKRRKDLQRVPDQLRVRMVRVDTRPFKEAADRMVQNCLQTMMDELKTGLMAQLQLIEQGSVQGLSRLQKKPSRAEEVREIKNTYLQLKGRQKDLQLMLEEAEVKNRWLLTTVGMGQQLEPAKQAFDRFAARMSDFDQILAEQMAFLKAEMGERQRVARNELDRFRARLEATKLSRKDLTLVDIMEAAELDQDSIEQWTQLTASIAQIQLDCKQFEMAAPELDRSAIEKEVAERKALWATFTAFDKEYRTWGACNWIQMRGKLFEFEDWLGKWVEELKRKQKEAVAGALFRVASGMAAAFSVLKLCQGQSFQREHWRSLLSLIGAERVQPQRLTLRTLMEREQAVQLKAAEIKELVGRAQGEATVREAIQELRSWCENAEFEFGKGGGARQVPLVREWKQLMSSVSDKQSLLSSLREGRFVARFQEQVAQFEARLAGLDQLLSLLNAVQRKWLYLQPIFARRALPSHSSKFGEADTRILRLLTSLGESKKVVSLNSPGQLQLLTSLSSTLDQCQKALNQYLQDKRQRFPRFYFLGDEDLLQLLGHGSDLEVVGRHLRKLFAAVSKVEGEKKVDAYCSAEGQRVGIAGVAVGGQVQIWLGQFQKAMFSSLEELAKRKMAQPKRTLQMDLPCQILCLTQQLNFSTLLASLKFKELRQFLKSLLEQLTGLTATSRGLTLLKLKALLLDVIHNISGVDQLLKEGVTSAQQFSFCRIMRYCWGEGGVEAVLLGCRLAYSFEYQGNLPKLVLTPLTDRCFMTLALAMRLGYGGNPYGPAGTGKTQSVKAMALALGRLCLVFNCDEGIDYLSMGRIFAGLIRCGAWGCFDEFNRLLEEQLSAISQQIQSIQWAIKEGKPKVLLLGRDVEVNRNSGIFVTLNPAGKGYGGRSKLPDNLKQLFRPVAMSVPDNELIAEVLLYAEGFSTAKALAEKVVALFLLCRQLLSAQQHYDWGLRALKTILTVAGRLRQEEGKCEEQRQAELLIKAVRINTLSKLTFADTKKFIAMLNDVFPGVPSNDIAYPEVRAAAEAALATMGLLPNEAQLKKVLQFYQATKQRMGVVLVGPSGCGKTTVWRVMRKAYETLGEPVRCVVISPKSMARTSLLGQMDHDTRQFSEGVLTQAAREAAREQGRSWVVLDGDIDPEWVQSLNSVLDDNHLLTLPTGQRVSFGPLTNFVFQTDNLQFASPATVSRMGMIHLSQEDLSLPDVIARWAAPLPQRDLLLPLLLQLNYDALESPLPTTRLGRLFDVLGQVKESTSKQQFFCQAFRGSAANASEEQRTSLLATYLDFFGQRRVPQMEKDPLDFFVKDGSIRCFGGGGEEIRREQLAGEDRPLVKTNTFSARLALLRPWMAAMQHIMVVGPEGCGKNLLVRSAIQELGKSQKVAVARIYCNSQTSGAQIVQKLYQVCQRATNHLGRVLRPLNAARVVLLLTNPNLPTPDRYATSSLISFLHSLLAHKGFHDPNSLEFVQVEKLQLICVLQPPSSLGRHPISTRLTALTRVLALGYSDPRPFLQQYSLALLGRENSSFSRLSAFLAELFSTVRERLNDQRHYSFTPKTLSAILAGLLRYQLSPDSLPEALAYEACRQFRDRLVSPEHRNRFDSILSTLLRSHFKNVPAPGFFTSLMGSGLVKVSKQDYQALFAQGLVAFQRESYKLSLVLTNDLLAQAAALDRALSSQGHVLLAGRSGVGRKSLVLLMGHMLRLQTRSLPAQRNYSQKQFKKDVRAAVQLAGQGQPVVLLVEDHHLQKPQFLEMINSLLMSGQVPGLIAPQEVDRILEDPESLRREALSGLSLYDAFCDRIRKNLRLVLSLDFARQSFLQNCAANPGTFGRTTLIWIQGLSPEAYSKIGNQLMAAHPQLVESSVLIHRSAIQQFNVPPRSFFALVNTFLDVLGNKLGAKDRQIKYLDLGLQKLKEAQSTVDRLSGQATEKKKLLKIKEAEAGEALAKNQVAMRKAAQRKLLTQKLSSGLQQEEVKLLEKKKVAENQLSQVKPLVDQAQKAVSCISKGNLDEVRSLGRPPPAIQHVLRSVCTLMGSPNLGWAQIKGVLKGRLVENILSFDARSIRPKMRAEVEAEINAHPESFRKENIYRASLAAGPLSDWLQAMLKYSKVLESIAPLEVELAGLGQQLESSKQRVKQTEEDLKVIQKEVKQLETIYAKRTTEAESLKMDLRKAEETTQSAASLLSKLEGERDRWQQQGKSIQTERGQLPSKALLASAYTVYLGSKDEATREKMSGEWKKLLKLSGWTYLQFMATEGELLQRKAEGLPDDTLTLQNSVSTFNSRQIPLLIDPGANAIQWLKGRLSKECAVVTISQQDPKFTTQLELAVRFGKTVLVQELDFIEPVLFPLIRGEVSSQGARKVVLVGDKLVDYGEGLRLFLCTRNGSMLLEPHSQALVTVLNFSITRSGLEGKLLSLIIGKYQPELEQRKTQLLAQEESLKLQLESLERKLLEQLANSKGNILENQTLLTSLAQTKTQSQEIKSALKTSADLGDKLDIQRGNYRGLATDAAQVYLAIRQLSSLNNMYRFSLPFYFGLFRKALDNTEEKPNLAEKLKDCSLNLRRLAFNAVAGGLFKADRLTFALHFAHWLKPQLFNPAEWEFFLGQTVYTGESKVPLPKWASPQSSQKFGSLVSQFGALASQLSQPEWANWVRQPECQSCFPSKVKLTSFQKVILVQVFRPQRLQSALTAFAQQTLSVGSLAGQTNSLRTVYGEQTSRIPMLLVVSAGYDPTKELQELAEKEVGLDKLVQMSMGGGQGEQVLAKVAQCAQKGLWICLKNLHLVTSFLPLLEKHLNSLQASQKFRLFLTTQPHPKFPPLLLQNCLKLAYEAPPGVKRSIFRSFQPLVPQLNNLSGNKPSFLLTASFMHALLMERRAYIPQGWSKAYQFGAADFRVVHQLAAERQGSIGPRDLVFLQGVMQEVVYGGRVDNSFDLKVLRAYLEKYLSPGVVGGENPMALGLVVPKALSSKDVSAFLQKIPQQDSPVIFGLPRSMDRTLQKLNSAAVISNLKQLASLGAEDLKFQREKWGKLLKPLLDAWDELQKGFGEKRKAAERLEEVDDPVLGFVFMEVGQAAKDLKVVGESLRAARQMLFGNGLVQTRVVQDCSSLLAGTTPPYWSQWEGPSDPLDWLKTFAKKMVRLKVWQQAAQEGKVTDSPRDLSDLFRPEVYLNAIRQKTARALGLPINQLVLVASLTPDKLPVQSFCLSNVLLQGAALSPRGAIVCDQGAEECLRLPPLYLCFVGRAAQLQAEGDLDQFQLFSSENRQRLLLRVKLPKEGSMQDLVLGGAALVLDQ